VLPHVLLPHALSVPYRGQRHRRYLYDARNGKGVRQKLLALCHPSFINILSYPY
jgi:hypothetical protein